MKKFLPLALVTLLTITSTAFAGASNNNQKPAKDCVSLQSGNKQTDITNGCQKAVRVHYSGYGPGSQNGTIYSQGPRADGQVDLQPGKGHIDTHVVDVFSWSASYL